MPYPLQKDYLMHILKNSLVFLKVALNSCNKINKSCLEKKSGLYYN